MLMPKLCAGNEVQGKPWANWHDDGQDVILDTKKYDISIYLASLELSQNYCSENNQVHTHNLSFTQKNVGD